MTFKSVSLRVGQWVVGLALAVLGGFTIIQAVEIARRTGATPVWLLLTGSVLIFAGGFVIDPTGAKGLVVLVAPYIPLIGGRRSYDPPAMSPLDYPPPDRSGYRPPSPPRPPQGPGAM